MGGGSGNRNAAARATDQAVAPVVRTAKARTAGTGVRERDDRAPKQCGRCDGGGVTKMRVLVTGGSGVVGQAAVAALVERGHEVRLLTRSASEDVAQWPSGVEAWPASITNATAVRGSADGCDAVLHCVGIVRESPPESTFELINVAGTRIMVEEAVRAGVGRFVYVSSLGADHGTSEYHRTKREGERLVEATAGDWLIVRPANVYGPGDEVISLLLKMVRSLPAIPMIGNGDDPFQPMWAEDVGLALAIAVERRDLTRKAIDIAGPEQVSTNQILDLLAKITDRSPLRVPVPTALASLGVRAAGLFGVELPINDGQITMLEERNVIDDPSRNALESVLGVKPTSLKAGLKKLADRLPEQLPDKGIGQLKRKRFWVDITGLTCSATELFEQLRTRFGTIMPIDAAAEPGTDDVLDVGETITMELPVRGHIQVRCERIENGRITLVTCEGHPLAGAVQFIVEPQVGGVVRFEVRVYDRPATVIDFLAMRAIGDMMQNANWDEVVRRVVELSGGAPLSDVQRDSKSLDDDQADDVDEWLKLVVMARKREENSEG